MARIAPKTLYGIDGVGVRRRIPAGSRIPYGLRLEEPLPAVDRRPPEGRRLRAEKAERKMPELRALAAERGIAVPFGVTKRGLLELLGEDT